MRKVFIAVLVAVILCLPAAAQTITKPTLNPVEPTPAQDELIRKGAILRREKRFEEAIEKQKQVLEQNKHSVDALYELVLNYYTSKRLDDALQVAMIGATYKSPLLPLFYESIANIADDTGNPEKAIEIYKNAIKIIEEDNGSRSHLSSMHFNLGITCARREMYPDARRELKRSIEYNQSYASPNYIIAVVFETTKYNVPALLAAGRFITMENGTQRSEGAAEIITRVLSGNVKKGDKPNSINIFVNTDSPKDEGDFGAMELFLGLSKASSETAEKNKRKTEEEKFAGQLESFINLFLEMADKKLKDTFVGKNYLPFYSGVKSKGHIEAFAYLIMQETGNARAREWVAKNNKKVFDFLDWAKKYEEGRF